MIAHETIRVLDRERRDDALCVVGWPELADDEPVWCRHCERVATLGDLRVVVEKVPALHGPRRAAELFPFVYCAYGDCDALLMDIEIVNGDGLNEPLSFVPSDWISGTVYPMWPAA